MISSRIRSQEIEPRSYAVVPTGLHAMALSYTYSSVNVITEGSSPLQNLNVTNNVFNLGYVQTFTFFDKLARIAVSIPFGFLNGSATFHNIDKTGSRTGFYDGRIKFGMNLLGSPALPPKDFQKFEERTVFGASFVIWVPLGQYYPSKLINLGFNRWGFKPELGLFSPGGKIVL